MTLRNKWYFFLLQVEPSNHQLKGKLNEPNCNHSKELHCVQYALFFFMQFINKKKEESMVYKF